MSEFTVEGFARACQEALASAGDAQAAVHQVLARTLAEHEVPSLLATLDASIPPGADIGEMIVHTSPGLTVLFGRVPARFQSAIHNHTIFACIGQLTGEETSVLYARDPAGGLRELEERTARAGEVIDLPADAIHRIENPGAGTSCALHVYGGDFRAVEPQRSLWTVEHEEQSFSFPALLRESVRLMKQRDNQPGLDALVRAVPAVQDMLASL